MVEASRLVKINQDFFLPTVIGRGMKKVVVLLFMGTRSGGGDRSRGRRNPPRGDW